MGSSAAMRDPSHVTQKINLCMHTRFYVSCSKGLYSQSNIFGFFGHDKNIEMSVFIYMYLKHSPDYIDSKYI